MQFNAQLDVDVVALEAEDEVTCLVSLTAPVPEEIAERTIESVRTALHYLVGRLKPQDRFGAAIPSAVRSGIPGV